MLIIMSASHLLSSITSLHGPELAAARNIVAVYSIDADLVVDEVGEAGVVPPHPHPHLQLSLRSGEALGTLRVNVANL